MTTMIQEYQGAKREHDYCAARAALIGNKYNGGGGAICENERLCQENDQLRAALDNAADIASKALRKAWQLGQTYWQQADSEYVSRHKKSDETRVKFQVLVDETRTAILGEVTPNT